MPKILVVDDEEDQEELIRQRIVKKAFLQDYEFLFVRSGIEAMEKIKLHPDIEIALLDINMPEMDGFTVIRKSKVINPFLSIILISAYDDEENIRMGVELGAFDFITKPVNFNLLEKSLKRIIEHISQLKRSLRAKPI